MRAHELDDEKCHIKLGKGVMMMNSVNRRLDNLEAEAKRKVYADRGYPENVVIITSAGRPKTYNGMSRDAFEAKYPGYLDEERETINIRIVGSADER